MKYVSKEKLQNLRAIQDQPKTTVETLDWIINAHCKELPPPQWQTIDEFKANTVEGWCWVDTVNLSTKMCFFSGAVFYTTDELTGFYVPTNITHVMPIKTPEAPK